MRFDLLIIILFFFHLRILIKYRAIIKNYAINIIQSKKKN